MPDGFLLIKVTRFFSLRIRRRDLVNSSSRAISSEICDVNRDSGEIENRWCRICSEILSFFFWDMVGMIFEGKKDLKGVWN